MLAKDLCGANWLPNDNEQTRDVDTYQNLESMLSLKGGVCVTGCVR